MSSQNISQSFIFQDLNVSGNIVKLGDLYKKLINTQDVTGVQAELLGQVVIISTLLIRRLKIECEMTIQFQSESDVKLLAVKIDTEGHLRATINCRVEPKEALLGDGFLVITIRQLGNNKQHQSVVKIHQGQSVSCALSDYFMQSEQMPTLFHVVTNKEEAAGIMLQRAQELVSADDWNTLEHLFMSLTDDELVSLDSQTILTRLFNDYNLKLFEPHDLSLKCSCSYEKMRDVIISLGKEEALDLLVSNKFIEIKCEYCKSSYDFNKKDVEGIFTQH